MDHAGAGRYRRQAARLVVRRHQPEEGFTVKADALPGLAASQTPHVQQEARRLVEASGPRGRSCAWWIVLIDSVVV
jgi:hypothetical protein